MKVLIACEESQRVCIAFRERGHEAYSCDILEPSGGHPEWHILRGRGSARERGLHLQDDGRNGTHNRGQMGFTYCTPAMHIFDCYRQSVV